MQCKKMYADIKTPVTCDAVKRKHSSMLKTSNGEQPIQSSSQSSYRWRSRKHIHLHLPFSGIFSRFLLIRWFRADLWPPAKQHGV